MFRAGICSAVMAILPLGLMSCSKAEPNTLTVSAKVELDVMPDAAIVNVYLSEQGKSREIVLETLVAKHKALREDLSAHDGIISISFEADEVSLRPVASAECAQAILNKVGEYADFEEIYQAYDLCPDKEYQADMDLSVTVSPPQAAGTVLSYTLLNDAAHAELDRFTLLDVQAARQSAKSAAAGKVRIIAQEIADQSEVKLGALSKLSFRGDRHFTDYDENDEVVVTGSRIKVVQETLRLDIDPKMITLSETVTATFVISE